MSNPILLTEEDFTARVMGALTIPLPEDTGDVRRIVRDCWQRGFSVAHAIRYCKLTEYISPDLDEDYALRMMAQYSRLYPNRSR